MTQSILAGRNLGSLLGCLVAGLLPGAGVVRAHAQAFQASAHLYGSGSFFSFPDVSNSSSVRTVSATATHSGSFDNSGNPSNLETASVDGSATAGFGDLHLFLTASTKGVFASGGSGANASSQGEVTFTDRIRFDNTSLPLGSDIQVRLELNVFASTTLVTDDQNFGSGSSHVDVSLDLSDVSGLLGSVSFSQTELQSGVYQYHVAPSVYDFGKGVVLNLKTGVNYTLSGDMIGSASAGTVVSAASPAVVNAAATMDAGHTALFAIQPQTSGTTFTASSGGSYQAVPEPGEWTLMAGGALLGFAAWRRCRRVTSSR